MNRQSWTIRLTGLFAAMAVITALVAMPALSQEPSHIPVDDQGNPLSNAAEAGYTDSEQPIVLSDSELAELIGPVALYPDDLLAIVLPASTYPLEIVQAARFLEQHQQDSTLQPNDDWDESVTALLNYPEVLRMLNDDIDWTWQLGDAVVNQQADVIAAVESFRDRAYAAGNLKSDEHQTVSEDDGIIEIVPVNDEVIYVPYYEPERVVVRQVTPVYYYYPRPYPVYYYPYPVGYSFYSDYFWGVSTAYRIGWASDYLHVYHHSYWGHPYFGHSYYGHYYRHPSVQVYNSWYVNNSGSYSSNRYRDGDYWRPRTHSRARPAYYSSRTRSYRDDDVSRGSSSPAYGNAYTSQISSQETANRRDRVATTGERVRTEQNSAREVPTDSIRFRERSENRQTVRRDPAATTTRSRSNTSTEPRTESRTDSRRSPVTTPTTAANNRTRESTRELVVRSPASGRSDSAVVRQSNRGSESLEPRQSVNASQPAPRDSNREATRVEARNSNPVQHESRTEARQESRQESGEVNASARQGNQARRERN